MNNFIIAEQFLKQNDKVQKTFLDWWKPRFGDIFTTKKINDEIDIIVDTTNFYIFSLNANFVNAGTTAVENKLEPFPLLQMHQLINFIEDKGYIWNKRGVYLDVDYILNGKYIGGYSVKLDNHSLLQALWQVACKIAEDI